MKTLNFEQMKKIKISFLYKIGWIEAVLGVIITSIYMEGSFANIFSVCFLGSYGGLLLPNNSKWQNYRRGATYFGFYMIFIIPFVFFVLLSAPVVSTMNLIIYSLIAAIILAVCALLLYKYWFAKKEFY
jgi:predicted ABC-type exoprotein transport system permease subunit